MNKIPDISVIVIFMNEEKYIENCIRSILNQKYNNFELVMVDDDSSDKSADIVKSFKDDRIRYFKNDQNLGITKTRNVGLKKAAGKYVFFTDADCVAAKDWLEQGKRHLDEGCLGVEGKTLYLFDETARLNAQAEKIVGTLTNDYIAYNLYLRKKTPISYRRVENLKGNLWMTCNMAYQANVLKKVGGFNDKFENLLEDRELALRVKKHGEISFSRNMIIYHVSDRWSFKAVIRAYRNLGKSKVYLYKYHRDNSMGIGRVILPYHLLCILFPFLLLLRGRVRGLADIKILWAFYLANIFERCSIWKTAWKEKIFVV